MPNNIEIILEKSSKNNEEVLNLHLNSDFDNSISENSRKTAFENPKKNSEMLNIDLNEMKVEIN